MKTNRSSSLTLAAQRHAILNRRHFLRGLGACLALPALETLRPVELLAADANQVGHLTRFPSLELTCDAVRKSGNCDSGYSCAYQYNLAWRSPTQPVAPEPNPRLLFERLFGAGAPGERKESLLRRQQQQRSILDFVLDDARELQRQLTSRDKQKLDEYLGSVREIEQRIERTERFGATPDPAVETPAGIPANFQDYIQLMYDMM